MTIQVEQLCFELIPERKTLKPGMMFKSPTGLYLVIDTLLPRVTRAFGASAVTYPSGYATIRLDDNNGRPRASRYGTKDWERDGKYEILPPGFTIKITVKD